MLVGAETTQPKVAKDSATMVGDPEGFQAIDSEKGEIIVLTHGFPDTWELRARYRGIAPGGIRVNASESRGSVESRSLLEVVVPKVGQVGAR